ncbi:uncharacterized protein LOC125560609 isoform X2 [Nematostella vectensis]|uniref:uncharacterized protein LOC125560609 isoform X2 n=1 Tax=Nematostella vectensis TaxID=45351 RepID=UPI0020776CFE|nr:uncharacterized protein LOC125560609 isoform X2 [Nematostella vectensis]
MWKRSDVSCCNCTEKKYRHVHCPCATCNGRATDRKTEIRHWKEANRAASRSSQRQCSTSAAQDSESFVFEVEDSDSEIEADNFTIEDNLLPNPDTPDTDETDTDDQDLNADNDNDNTNHDANSRHYNPLKRLVVDAVLNALKIQKESGMSIKTFEDILEFGKRLLLDSSSEQVFFDRDILTTLWPKSWSDVQALLKEEGYQDAREYFICFCYKTRPINSDTRIKYTGKYSLMTSKDEVCSNCGNKGVIAYYYLGLQNKVKNWFRDENMCNKMLSHWNEREHWLGVEQSWPIKKEMWDGERWNELQWFWDPNKTWVIPCRCEHCGIPIPAKHLIESQDAVTAGKKLVECPECLESFEHSLKTTNGSPINIALIGNWDGWQAFSSSTRSCGSLEVSIANMKKADRSHTSEVYVVGFVPLSSTPKLQETYDPFLQPLMEDICEGFINGFEVRLPQEPNMKRVRVLLLCWSGDHPGQCEVGKLLNQGKCPCRRCKLVGQHLPMNESNNHMYYGDNRIHYRHKWESRDISLMLTDLYDVEAESRISVRKRMSSEKGVTGISLLHKYLYPLYNFDILKDLTFDVFHTVCLNVVKSQAERILDHELVDKKSLDREIKNFPWPRELKCGRLPKSIQSYNGSLGQWKAEGLQKFSFPMADCVLDSKLESPKEQEIQHLISRLTELHFNSGRYGWTNSMIGAHHRLAWRLNILIEETQGLEMCSISVHNLLHIHEDIIRFSATDNYWCAVFERAVKGYTKTASNCRGVEKTFALAESRREFLKPYSTQEIGEQGKINMKVVTWQLGENQTRPQNRHSESQESQGERVLQALLRQQGWLFSEMMYHLSHFFLELWIT